MRSDQVSQGFMQLEDTDFYLEPLDHLRAQLPLKSKLKSQFPLKSKT